jgi:hypothetical protein
MDSNLELSQMVAKVLGFYHIQAVIKQTNTALELETVKRLLQV